MKNTIIITVIVALIVGGASFFVGTKYQQSKQANLRGQFNRQGQLGLVPGQGTGTRNSTGQGRMGFRSVNGEIISSDEKSITVKLTDGSSKIVIFSDKTVINKTDTATVVDLKVGEKVAVIGSDNTDGSVTAQNIQLNPISRGFLENLTPTPGQ